MRLSLYSYPRFASQPNSYSLTRQSLVSEQAEDNAYMFLVCLSDPKADIQSVFRFLISTTMNTSRMFVKSETPIKDMSDLPEQFTILDYVNQRLQDTSTLAEKDLSCMQAIQGYLEKKSKELVTA